jgi:3D (Asp-Asp-Asp) domain-containing protein
MRCLALSLALAACGNSSPGGASASDAGHAGDATTHADAAAPTDSSTTSDAPSSIDTGVPLDAAGAGTDASDAGATGEAGTTVSMEVTFYGWADNSPPGNAIAYPMNGGYPTVHDAAGGTGTYADPITFATDPTELAPGTRVYAPFIEKYLIMEDSCGQCETDWSSHARHIDVWMNSDGTEDPTDLENCEDQWTQTSTPVEIDPPQGRTVTTNPLFVPATNTCRTSP